MSKNKTLDPIRTIAKHAKRRGWHYSLEDGMFTSAMGFAEFPGITAGMQANWCNDIHLTGFLLIDYEPQIAEACDFRAVINDLNDEMWGVTYIWKEATNQMACKIIETVKKFSSKDADTFLEHLHIRGHTLLTRVYPQTAEDQALWDANAAQRLLLENSDVQGTA
ncbi:MAG: hypothetical protein ACI9H6_000650 [Patiriisocius sp.]|jgi:hypothetical protein